MDAAQQDDDRPDAGGDVRASAPDQEAIDALACGEMASPLDVGDLLEHGLRVVLQPIIDLRSTLALGFEALVRPGADVPLAHAGEVIAACEAEDRVADFERAVRRLAFPHVHDLPDDVRLFVNAMPDSFASAAFADRVAEDAAACGIDPARVVVELTEHVGEIDWTQVDRTAEALRGHGFEIALDDVGAGLSGLNRVLSIRPDWIKLDLELVRDVDFDPLRQNLLRFLVDFTRLSGIRVVAEGIEREGELLTLMSLGVPAGQGHHLGRPATAETWARATATAAEPNAPDGTDDRDGAEPRAFAGAIGSAWAADVRANARGRIGDVPLLSIAGPPLTAGPDTPAAMLLARMRETLGSRAAIVTEDDRPIGWVSETALRRAIERDEHVRTGDVRRREVLVASEDTSVGEALLLMSEGREEDDLPLVAIAGRDGALRGMVSPRQMLVAAAEPRLRPSAHVAPITGLPDRVQADQWLEMRRELNDEGDLAFIDVRHFASYNVAYGFEKGDELLLRVANELRGAVQRRPDAFTHVAHIGEDRFVVALRCGASDAVADLAGCLERMQDELFPPGDVARGAARTPAGEDLPLASLRTIVLEDAFRCGLRPARLHRRAVMLRGEADRAFAEGRRVFTARPCADDARERTRRSA